MSDFDKAFAMVIGEEGGYVNNPNDPGGETKYGICKRDYPDVDIKNLTIDQAKQIYYRDYWSKIKGDQLPWPLSVYVFDGAVNQGTEAAVKLLQKTLGVAQDGIFGTATLGKAITLTPDGMALYLADRALRYTGTRNFDTFGRGWFKRLFELAMEAV